MTEASPRSAWVGTDDLNDGNSLHYSVEGHKKLGERFAQKSIDRIKKNAQ